MSLGRRGGHEKQESIWIEGDNLAKPSGHPFYERLNVLLDKQGFDCFAEQACAGFYSRTGRPGLAPSVYFRCLLVGYFDSAAKQDAGTRQTGILRPADGALCDPRPDARSGTEG